MVLPPRGAHIKRGVFATRSPYRPNPIGMSAVKVDRIEGLRIFIRQFDLLDGTPILDIKPYLPYADSFPDSAAGWTEALSRESSEYQIFFSDLSREQLQWLKSEGLTEIENFVVQQLTTEPTDQKRKRVRQVADRDPAVFQLSYRTWRIDFKVTAPGNEQRSVDQIEVLRITSGYSHEELSNTETDRYNDKLLHLKFINHF